MAKGQVKKAQVQKVQKAQVQAENTIFALDIGTRSIIGMVGVVEEEKVKIIAIEKVEHTERAMIDGQIENIEKVTSLARKVKARLEEKVNFQLSRVCVAAAGRALRTKRAEYEINLPGKQLIDDETGEPFTAHTTNPVPFILVNADPAYKLREGGCLADIIPTLIELMGMEQPEEMTGKSLLVK